MLSEQDFLALEEIRIYDYVFFGWVLGRWKERVRLTSYSRYGDFLFFFWNWFNIFPSLCPFIFYLAIANCHYLALLRKRNWVLIDNGAIRKLTYCVDMLAIIFFPNDQYVVWVLGESFIMDWLHCGKYLFSNLVKGSDEWLIGCMDLWRIEGGTGCFRTYWVFMNS